MLQQYKSLFLLIFVGGAASAQAQIISPGIFNPTTGHTYYLLQAATWTSSETFAESLGSSLVSIDDAAEQTWVYNTFSNYDNIQRSLWLGLNDVASAGTFVWSNGSSATYRNWASGEPNGIGVERYVATWAPRYGNAGQWNNFTDISSYTRDGFNVGVHGVIEAVPEPATLIALASGAVMFVRRKGHKKSRERT